jgi:hypothetical protein
VADLRDVAQQRAVLQEAAVAQIMRL